MLSIAVVLAGTLAALDLPISQYPKVTPPTIQVDCNYPGASARVVSDTIASAIEQRVNGVENMLYMSSQSTSDGSYTLTITFETGTDLDIARVLVQNRVNLALPELPDVVKATGITTRKRSPEILLTISLNSPDGRYDQLYLSNYAAIHIKEEMSRIDGVSDVIVFGQRDYSMRVWIDPDRLASRNLTALDVVQAIQTQNLQVTLGQLGARGTDPASAAARQVPLTVVGRLTDAQDFGAIVVGSPTDGRLTRLRDVARVELGSRSEDVSNRFDGKPTVGLAVFLLSDANALACGDEIKAKIAELAKDFPDGVHYEIGYDTTPFMRESIKEVFKGAARLDRPRRRRRVGFLTDLARRHHPARRGAGRHHRHLRRDVGRGVRHQQPHTVRPGTRRRYCRRRRHCGGRSRATPTRTRPSTA